MADTVRAGLDRLVLDALGSEALEQRVEPSDGEGDPACARPPGVRLDEEPGALVDLPENLVPDAIVRGSPEEPRVRIDADALLLRPHGPMTAPTSNAVIFTSCGTTSSTPVLPACDVQRSAMVGLPAAFLTTALSAMSSSSNTRT
jgi:hypothetical protein